MKYQSDYEKRRRNIFDTYSANLHLLAHNGIIDIQLRYPNTYICPICLEQFSEEALNQDSNNPLTLEDAPPKSLGGKANVLTCKACNNKCGSNLDYHLAQQLNEKDWREFRPGVEFDAHFEKDGRTIQGRVRVGLNGDAKVTHLDVNNNPLKLREHVMTTKHGDGVSIKFKKSKVEPDKIKLALLKTAYLLTFRKYGYAFILDNVYDRIRNQLRNPENVIYPLDFWFNAPFPTDIVGSPFITEKGLEAIFTTFVLKTKFSERMFSAVIPITSVPIETIIAEIKLRFEQDSTFPVTLDLMKEADYLTDIDAIKKMLDWIAGLKNRK